MNKEKLDLLVTKVMNEMTFNIAIDCLEPTYHTLRGYALGVCDSLYLMDYSKEELDYVAEQLVNKIDDLFEEEK